MDIKKIVVDNFDFRENFLEDCYDYIASSKDRKIIESRFNDFCESMSFKYPEYTGQIDWLKDHKIWETLKDWGSSRCCYPQDIVKWWSLGYPKNYIVSEEEQKERDLLLEISHIISHNIGFVKSLADRKIEERKSKL